MPENTNAGDGNNNSSTNTDQNNNNGNDGGEAGSKKTVTQQTQAFDPAKIGDEDFEKIFDDPRVFKHPRFASLREKAKKAEDYEKAEQTRKEEELKKKGEFEQLAKQKEEEVNRLKADLQTSKIDTQIQSIAARVGVKSIEAVLKLIDRSGIKYNDDGTVSGVEEAVKALLDKETYLKGTPGQVTIGSATSPGNDTSGTKKFKLSQLQDPAFYKENEKAILEAYKNNLIEDDMSS